MYGEALWRWGWGVGVGGSVKKGMKLVGRVCAQKRLTILGEAEADPAEASRQNQARDTWTPAP